MSKRIEIFKFAPEAYKGFAAVKHYVQTCSLPAELVELVNLRVSQINGCAFCIDMHSRALLEQGVKIEKLVLLPVWHEADVLFSDKERAALAWAESVTRVAQTNAPDDDYRQAAAVLSEQELSDLTVAIALMNAYNRIGIGTRIPPASLAR